MGGAKNFKFKMLMLHQMLSVRLMNWHTTLDLKDTYISCSNTAKAQIVLSVSQLKVYMHKVLLFSLCLAPPILVQCLEATFGIIQDNKKGGKADAQ